MQDIEVKIAEDVWEWFGELLSGLEEPEDMMKAELPLPGFVMGRLGDENWWTIFNAQLADKLQQRLIDAARLGVASAGRQLGIVLDWQMLLPQVLNWAREHAGALVRQVSDNIRADIRQIVVDGLQAGRSWREMRERIQELGLPKWRAERIARTEVIAAHAHGAQAGYEASGTVRGLRWLDGQVEACPLCRQLHNQVRRLGEPFYTGKFGDGLPPRHPHCRCALAPVTLDEVKRLPANHPLRDNRRLSVAELTDRETWMEIGGIIVSGQARRHWQYRHSGQFDVKRAEEMLPRLLHSPEQVRIHRGLRVHIMEWGEKSYLIAPISQGRLLSMYVREKRQVNKWPMA